MVLRRVMSGWLIALAALARAMAAALERAAVERSEPAIDPVMAELRERYPDAPDHWLAFIAERMSTEARSVEAAAPGSVKPAAWPSPDAREPSPAPAMETSAPDRSDAPVAEPSVASGALPARRRQAPMVPTMAELASRSTETWRGPSASPRRPSRPVFARPVDPPPTAPVSTILNSAPPAPPRRPRSPLALAPRKPFPPPPPPREVEQVPEDALSERRREAFQEGPRGERRTEVVASPEDRAPKVATPSRREAQGGDDRVAGPRQAEPVPTARFDTARPPVDLPRFSETSAASVPATPAAPASRATPAAQASRATPAALWRERPGRSPAEPVFADARPVEARRSVAAAPAVGSPSAASRPSPPEVKRSFVRRLIDKAVASAPGRRPTPDATRETPTHRSPSSSFPSGTAHVPSRIAHRSSNPVAGPDLAPAGHAAGGEGRGVAARPSFGPAREPLIDVAWPPVRREDRAAANAAWTPSSSRPPRHREFAVSTRRPAPLEAADRDPASAVEDRWPSLPPGTFAPTPAAEASAPRWSRLAREQEEGLWNA